jgi:hypothetical protein
LPFKCNLQRYTTALRARSTPSPPPVPPVQSPAHKSTAAVAVQVKMTKSDNGDNNDADADADADAITKERIAELVQTLAAAKTAAANAETSRRDEVETRKEVQAALADAEVGGCASSRIQLTHSLRKAPGDPTLDPMKMNTWFQQKLLSHSAWYRYTEARLLRMSVAQHSSSNASNAAVGLYRLNQVDP